MLHTFIIVTMPLQVQYNMANVTLAEYRLFCIDDSTAQLHARVPVGDVNRTISLQMCPEQITEQPQRVATVSTQGRLAAFFVYTDYQANSYGLAHLTL